MNFKFLKRKKVMHLISFFGYLLEICDDVEFETLEISNNQIFAYYKDKAFTCGSTEETLWLSAQNEQVLDELERLLLNWLGPISLGLTFKDGKEVEHTRTWIIENKKEVKKELINNSIQSQYLTEIILPSNEKIEDLLYQKEDYDGYLSDEEISFLETLAETKTKEAERILFHTLDSWISNLAIESNKKDFDEEKIRLSHITVQRICQILEPLGIFVDEGKAGDLVNLKEVCAWHSWWCDYLSGLDEQLDEYYYKYEKGLDVSKYYPDGRWEEYLEPEERKEHIRKLNVKKI